MKVNQEQPLDALEMLLDSVRPISPGTYYVLLYGDELELFDPKSLAQPPAGGIRIARLTSIDVNEGLSPRRWDAIATLIRHYLISANMKKPANTKKPAVGSKRIDVTIDKKLN